MPDFPTDRPRVFLSHSKADAAFVERVRDDFFKCQIHPWLDTQEIRHGQPWLDAIFVGGIPTCDCVLVYLTETSIESPMVKKEIDAAIVKKLQDNHVAFLPYVSHAALRKQLRVDIQALQTLEWNNDNYTEFLPTVIAEIWHSFMDRRLIVATSEERAKRLEMELEVERHKNAKGGVFSDSEEKDFGYIWKQFDREESFKFAIARVDVYGKHTEISSVDVNINCQPLVAHINEYMRYELNYHALRMYLTARINDELDKDGSLPQQHDVTVTSKLDFRLELLTFGLLRRETETEYSFNQPRTVGKQYLSEKMMRFRYWLAYNDLIDKASLWKAGQAEDIANRLKAGTVTLEKS